MKVILGIGNPGKKYENTPHNIGFHLVDSLSESGFTPMGKDSLVEKINLAGETVILLKPQTYVNLSGNSAQKVMHFYKINPDDLIVVVDDVNLEWGAIRIRSKGSHGGHNGLKSLIQHIGSNFTRIRVGVGLCPEYMDLSAYVLRQLTNAEKNSLNNLKLDFKDLVEFGIKEGWEKAGAKFNRKSL